mgnify:CR=1 FL=1
MRDSGRLRNRRRQRGPRTIETRRPRCETFLIVSEGAKTEPYYFEGLVRSLVGTMPEEVEIEGAGRVTTSLVEWVAKKVNRSPRNYDNVWVVFDRDDFKSFDEAVFAAERNGFHAAWSNEAFEYWLCLYLGRYDSALSRGDWVGILDAAFRKAERGGFEKNREDIFSVLDELGDHEMAKRFAKSVREQYEAEEPPSRRNPCTTVDLLVEQLERALID